MLTKRIISCLDCVNGRVVKGVQFQNHEDMGDVKSLAKKYSDANFDELVLYNITSSADKQTVSYKWVREISKVVNIPFCVAGGIRTITDADSILNNGADKISINTPALQNPNIIDEFVKKFGSQAVVIGIDVKKDKNQYVIYQNTGRPESMSSVNYTLEQWVYEIQERGAGEVVINSINKDGTRNGYDIELLQKLRNIIKVPIIASGGAGSIEHFSDVFIKSNVDGALAASIFHKNIIDINILKKSLQQQNIPIRL